MKLLAPSTAYVQFHWQGRKNSGPGFSQEHLQGVPMINKFYPAELCTFDDQDVCTVVRHYVDGELDGHVKDKDETDNDQGFSPGICWWR